MGSKRKKCKLAVGDLRDSIVSRIDRALKAVQQTTLPQDESIHDTRRQCKRIRAYLDLFAVFDKSLAKKASRHVRDAARQLSPYRDCQIIPQAIDRVGSRIQAQSATVDLIEIMRSVTPIEAPSVDRLDRTCQPLEKTLLKVAKQLQKARRLIKSMTDYDKFLLDVDALRRSYASGRDLIQTARREAAPEAFHNLRKAVKMHLYQCQFLTPLSKCKLQPRIKAVRDLGELLGSAQDIMVLQNAIASSLDSDIHAECEKVCCVVAAELQSSSLAEGCVLYFDSPDDFIRELAGASCS